MPTWLLAIVSEVSNLALIYFTKQLDIGVIFESFINAGYCKNVYHEGDVLILAHSLELPPKPPTPFPCKSVETFKELPNASS